MDISDIIIKPSKYLPEKLKNTDSWRPAALYFQEHKKYCSFSPNPAPNSPWTKFWTEERRRCIEGYKTEAGYISGYYYYYLNYCPIWRLEYKEGAKKAERVYDFPDVFDGDYEFFSYIEEAESLGKHGIVLKRRGSGYSFKLSGMCCRNFFHIRGSRSLALAHEKTALTDDGILSKAWDNINFINENTPFSTPMQKKDTDLHKRNSYMIKDANGQPLEVGMKSEIIGISMKDNTNKARGKRAKLIVYEEGGNFSNLDTTWEINRPSVEQDGVAFGIQIIIGTGGTMGEGARSLEQMFDKPDAYNILPVDNIWEKVAEGKKVGLFVPAWKNWKYDKDGNTLIEESIKEILAEREKEKKAGKSEQLILQRAAELPLVPSEAVMRVTGVFFPVQILKEQKAEITVNSTKYLDSNYIGKFVRDPQTGEPIFKSVDTEAIREYPITTKRPGVIEIFTMPQRNSQGIIPFGTYLGGIDPLDDDYSSTQSMFSCHIFNRYTRKIVAEYITRDEDVKHSWEQCRLLLKYYNAVALYENDKKGIYNHFEKMHSLHLLADTPHQLKDSEWRPGTNKSKGVSAIRGKTMGRNALKSWLREPLDVHGEILSYQRIYSLGLLEEMIQWNPDDNFDRVDSMSYCMLLDDTMYRSEQALVERVKKETDDPYWNLFKNKSNIDTYNYLLEEDNSDNQQDV